mmetsp:Transcript_13227/g.31719  ORF Transcript_13227/g.31719 Transcript_13227/m.31719 type:complete len:116 (-) Transcript_13227:1630-1977(-)
MCFPACYCYKKCMGAGVDSELEEENSPRCAYTLRRQGNRKGWWRTVLIDDGTHLPGHTQRNLGWLQMQFLKHRCRLAQKLATRQESTGDPLSYYYGLVLTKEVKDEAMETILQSA